jgi:hypothetical protein
VPGLTDGRTDKERGRSRRWGKNRFFGGFLFQISIVKVLNGYKMLFLGLDKRNKLRDHNLFN